MKLEGSLDAFSLPDIFQLLSFTKKSGGLHLRRAATHGCVYFRDGMVSGAISDDGRQALARRILGSSNVGDDVLAAAVDRAATEGVGVGRALLDAGVVDGDILRAMVAEQAVDAVFDFLRWGEGDFSFTVDEPGPDDVGVSLGVETIVGDARGRLESWDDACRVIPSPDTILALPIAVRDDPRLSRAEWALVALVDGRRSVADLVGLAGRGDFAVVAQLAALVDRGLLAVRTPESDEGAPALARRHAILARLETTAAVEQRAADQASEPARAPSPDRQASFASAPFASSPTAPAEDPAVTGAAGPASDDSIFAGVNMHGTSTVASVLAAAAGGESSPFTRTQPPESPESPAESRRERDAATTARFVADTRTPVTPVTPARPEPFMPRRRPDFPEDHRAGMGSMGGGSMGGGSIGSAAVAAAHPEPGHVKSHIERDPSVNKSLLLRLIAGVRGL